MIVISSNNTTQSQPHHPKGPSQNHEIRLAAIPLLRGTVSTSPRWRIWCMYMHTLVPFPSARTRNGEDEEKEKAGGYKCKRSKETRRKAGCVLT